MLMETTKTLAPDGKPFHLFTLKNSSGMQIQVMDWGATWLSCQVPVQNSLREVLLGCRPAQYPEQKAYLGASVGRYANRIARARFTLNGRQFKLVANQGKHQLHGGVGFDKRRWQAEKCGAEKLSFSLFSPDGEQGFAGNVTVSVCYELTEDNAVKITYAAQSDQDTPLNLTNHAYFNLLNAETGCDVRKHYLQLFADRFLPVDNEGIPNAPLKSVSGNSFDFRREKAIATDFLQQEQQVTKGYDHAFLLNPGHETAAAVLTAPDRSLRLTVSTSQAAMQVYSGNFLNGTPTRHSGVYADYSGIALETQALPDTPNHPEWRQYGGISRAGKTYRHWTIFKFS